MMRLVLLLLAITLLPAAASAQSTLLYTRSSITILRKNPPVVSLLPWQDKAVTPQSESPAVVFDVEVRDGGTLYRQDGWYNLSSPVDNGGVLMLFAEPGISPINHSPQYAPLDILMINTEGTITQIVPDILLSTLEQDIVPQSPVLAFLFIKGGLCEKLAIHPGDSVEYKAFRKPPLVLGAPAAPKEAAPAAPAPTQDTPPSDAPARNLGAPMMMETK